MNEGMRLWGHVFVYDEAELRMAFAEAGFTDVKRVPFGKSEHADLDGIETRGDLGDLILEGRA
jgi:predicted SAM-dependent methyltransferase